MISLLIRLIVSGSFLCLLGYMLKDDIPSVVEAMKNAEPAFLLLAFLFAFSACGFMGYRLKMIFRAQGIKIRWKEGVSVTFVGIFFNNFFPTSVGGDVVKAYCLARKNGSHLLSFSGVLLDRFFGLSMFVLIPSMTVFFLTDQLDPRVPGFVMAMLVIALAAGYAIFDRRWVEKFAFLKPYAVKIPLWSKFADLYEAMHRITHHRMAVVKVCLCAVGAQVLSILSVWGIVAALGFDINLFYIFLSVPIVHLFSMIPSINGLGIRETGFVYFFQSAMGQEAASALAILYLGLLITLSILGGIIYFVRSDYHFKIPAGKSGASGNGERERV